MHSITRRAKRILVIGFCLFALGTAGAGDSLRTPNACNWSDTIGMARWGDHIYTVEKNGGLYRTDPKNGNKVQVGKPDFADTEFFFSDNYDIYSIEADGSLYRINPKDGAWKPVGRAGDWKDTIAVAPLFYKTFFSIEKSGTLYKTDLTTGEWVQVGNPDFANTRFLFSSAASDLFTIEADGSFYRIHTGNGKWEQLGQAGDWKGTLVGTGYNYKLYTVEDNGCLYETDLPNGVWRQVGKQEFGNAKFMCRGYDSLFFIEDGNLYHLNPKTGVRTAVGM